MKSSRFFREDESLPESLQFLYLNFANKAYQAPTSVAENSPEKQHARVVVHLSEAYDNTTHMGSSK